MSMIANTKIDKISENSLRNFLHTLVAVINEDDFDTFRIFMKQHAVDKFSFISEMLETNNSVESTNLSNRMNLNSLALTKTTKETMSLASLRKSHNPIKLKQVESPEEIHYLYVDLNKQNKKLAYKFERTSVIDEGDSSGSMMII